MNKKYLNRIGGPSMGRRESSAGATSNPVFIYTHIGFFPVLPRPNSRQIKPQSFTTTLAKSAGNVPQATTRDLKDLQDCAGNTRLGSGGVVGMAMKKAPEVGAFGNPKKVESVPNH